MWELLHSKIDSTFILFNQNNDKNISTNIFNTHPLKFTLIINYYVINYA